MTLLRQRITTWKSNNMDIPCIPQLYNSEVFQNAVSGWTCGSITSFEVFTVKSREILSVDRIGALFRRTSEQWNFSDDYLPAIRRILSFSLDYPYYHNTQWHDVPRYKLMTRLQYCHCYSIPSTVAVLCLFRLSSSKYFPSICRILLSLHLIWKSQRWYRYRNR